MHIILSCMVEFFWYCWCFEQLKFLIAGAIALKGLGGVLFIFGSSFGALLLVCSQNLLYEYIGFHFLLMCFIFLVITLNLIVFLGISSCTSWLLPQSIMIFTIMIVRTKNLLNCSSNWHRSEKWFFLISNLFSCVPYSSCYYNVTWCIFALVHQI